MSKQTLEKLLADAKPVVAKTSRGEYGTLDELLEYYCEQTGYRGTAAKYLADKPFTVNRGLGSWDGIPFLVGIIHRAQYDGYKPLEIIGLTPEQQNHFQVLCELIRTKAYEQIQGGKAKPNTPTRYLYDQIIANGF